MIFTELPESIIDRILFFAFLEGGLEAVVNLSLTCSTLRKQGNAFLYSAIPLVVRDKPLSQSKSYEMLDNIEPLCRLLSRDLRLYDYKNQPLSFDGFQCLSTLTVEARDLSFLVKLAPLERLRSFTIVYDHKKFDRKHVAKMRQEMEGMGEELAIPALEVFRVSSAKPKVDTPFRNLISPNWKNPRGVEDYDKQFSSSTWSKYALAFQGKHKNLGAIFFMILENTKKSIRVAEILGIDFSFIMSRERTLKFSRDCNLILNNPSIIHAYSWMERVKSKKRLTILIENRITSTVLVVVKKKNKEPVILVKDLGLLVEMRNRMNAWV